MGEKIVHQHGVKGNPTKEIHRRAPNKTLREVKKAIKRSWADACLQHGKWSPLLVCLFHHPYGFNNHHSILQLFYHLTLCVQVHALYFLYYHSPPRPQPLHWQTGHIFSEYRAFPRCVLSTCKKGGITLKVIFWLKWCSSITRRIIFV